MGAVMMFLTPAVLMLQAVSVSAFAAVNVGAVWNDTCAAHGWLDWRGSNSNAAPVQPVSDHIQLNQLSGEDNTLFSLHTSWLLV